MTIINGIITEIIADEGKYLTNDDINYSTHLYLGKDDSPSNWYEVEVPQDEQLSTENSLPY